MARKTRYGKCKLCGKKAWLTFEHVPPKSVFNDKTVKIISSDKMLGDNERFPWNLTGLPGIIQQKGKGGYYLCEKCNNTSGSWYVPYYEQFIKGILSVLQNSDPNGIQWLGIKISQFRPLPILKQIMLMFCDINNNCFNDDNLRQFLLNKEQRRGFNADKYKLYAYVMRGTIEHQSAVMCKARSILTDPQIIAVSEIASFPVGFALYIDLPRGYIPEGTLINSFADYRYEDVCQAEMSLPLLECNTIIAGDYRGKEEIRKTIEETNYRLNNNKDR